MAMTSSEVEHSVPAVADPPISEEKKTKRPVKGFKMTPRVRRELLARLRGPLLHVLEYHWEWSGPGEISRRYVSQVVKGTGYSRNVVCRCHTAFEEMGFLVCMSEPKRGPDGKYEPIPKQWKVVLVPDSAAPNAVQQQPKKKGVKGAYGQVAVEHKGHSPEYHSTVLTESVSHVNQYTKAVNHTSSDVDHGIPTVHDADGMKSRFAPLQMDVPTSPAKEEDLSEVDQGESSALNDVAGSDHVLSPLEQKLTVSELLEKHQAKKLGKPWSIPTRLSPKPVDVSLVAPQTLPPVPVAPPPMASPLVEPGTVSSEGEHDWVVCPEYKTCPLCKPIIHVSKHEQDQIKLLAAILKENMKMERSFPESSGSLALLLT
jgi:hypothetical protein